MKTTTEQTSMDLTIAITRTLGFFPPFFLPALHNSSVLENLWQQTLSAYVYNPLPALFKEQLFAYLSRYCRVPYCIVCHSCALRPLGMRAGDILRLLETPAPSEEILEEQVLRQLSSSEPLKEWLAEDTELMRALQACAIYLFLRTAHADSCYQQMARLLGPTRYTHLIAFLGYVKTCHLWVEAHDDLAYEADQRAQEHLGALLAEEPALGDFFRSYAERVSLEQSRREEMLLAELAERRHQEQRLHHEREESQARELSLREANRQMEEFLGIAGHELRTPLTTIKANLQFLLSLLSRRAKTQTGQEAPAILTSVQEGLARTLEQSGRMERLVNDLLDDTRIQHGHLEIALERCDLSDIVRRVVIEQQRAWPRRRIICDLPGGNTLMVVADEQRIGQVLTNYIVNALKYSKQEYEVQVSLGRTEAHARVSVRDHGPGLSLEEQEHIWQRYYRIPGRSTADSSRVGLGLGLYISQMIVKQHKGEVGVESTPGQGSTFWFTLPLAN